MKLWSKLLFSLYTHPNHCLQEGWARGKRIHPRVLKEEGQTIIVTGRISHSFPQSDTQNKTTQSILQAPPISTHEMKMMLEQTQTEVNVVYFKTSPHLGLVQGSRSVVHFLKYSGTLPASALRSVIHAAWRRHPTGCRERNIIQHYFLITQMKPHNSLHQQATSARYNRTERKEKKSDDGADKCRWRGKLYPCSLVAFYLCTMQVCLLRRLTLETFRVYSVQTSCRCTRSGKRDDVEAREITCFLQNAFNACTTRIMFYCVFDAWNIPRLFRVFVVWT